MTEIVERSSPSAFGGNGAFARPGLFRHLTRWRLSVATQLLDLAVITSLAILLYPVTGGSFAAIPTRYVMGAVVVASICHFSFAQGHLYQMDALMDETRAIKSILVRWSVLFLGLAATGAMAHAPELFSRSWFVGFYAGGATALAAERSMVAMLVRQWIARGHSTQSVVLVGYNELTDALLIRLEETRRGIRVLGVFDDREDTPVGHIRGVPLRGSVDDLLEYTRDHATDLVVITLPIAATDRINAVIAKLRHQPLNIRVLPGAIGLDRVSPMKLSRNDLPGVQLIAVADRPISELALFVKGAMDRVAAAVGLAVAAPLFFAVAVGIMLTSRGPVLFRQERVGYQGRLFGIYKFRTMHHEFCGSYTPTAKSDDRVFGFGRLLRKLSLDELPQLINVLKGEMSLVGPRPHMVGQKVGDRSFFEAVVEYAGRHRVKPGITGWAQVNGWRGPTDTLEQIERRVEHDIYYIENWSLMLDVVILVRTVFVGFFGKNAF